MAQIINPDWSDVIKFKAKANFCCYEVYKDMSEIYSKGK